MPKKTPTKKPTKRLQDEIYPGFTERSERGSANRKKGVTFERKVAQKMREIFPGARRMFGQAREGDEVPDVGGTPFWVECAKGSTNAIHEKLAQGMAATKSSPSDHYRGKPVVVVSNAAKGLTMVTMQLRDFLTLCDLLPWENEGT